MAACAVGLALAGAPVQADWLNWRGPGQSGASAVTGLVEQWSPEGAAHLWSIDLPGRGSVVVRGQRGYVLGYVGSGPDVRETLVCFDVASGKTHWQRYFNDFLSDVIYNRYSIGAPVIDGQTGNVYILTSGGLVAGFSPDGKPLWEVSMMEDLGRLTFPNGRLGAPVVFGDTVIVHGITSNWGRDTPARDRFYAFDKLTGEVIWSATPGVGAPFLKDSSFSTPVIHDNLLYSGTGCGNLVCINAITGEPQWRYQMAIGGVNASPVIYGNTVILTHDLENIDESATGRMIAVKLGSAPALAEGKPGPVEITRDSEAWRNGIGSFSSSPTLAGDRLYVCTFTGEVVCINPKDGAVLWRIKLAPDQLHASPLYADGKLYVPFQNGLFYILRPSDTGAEMLAKVQLAGSALGSPTVSDGRIFVHTTEKLYCFGDPKAVKGKDAVTALAPGGSPASAPKLLVMPGDFTVRPGQRLGFTLIKTDDHGSQRQKLSGGAWDHFVPPTAVVKSQVDATFDGDALVAAPGAKLSAGSQRVQAAGLTGFTRGRILPAPPFQEDFQAFELTQNTPELGAHTVPPLPWIGARGKWVIVEREGNKVLKKTLDNILFQRAMTFIGHHDERGLTVEADVMSDGNRRMMSVVGVINQRYIIALVGNAQILEVSSNHERVKLSVPFKWQPNVWYRLKTRVDVAADGTGTIRAKAWKKGDPEPQAWTLEAKHANAHTHGSPGLFGFAPGSQFPVYIDNVVVTKEGAN
jgi:outer membrane protein assembly factor BamB